MYDSDLHRINKPRDAMFQGVQGKKRIRPEECRPSLLQWQRYFKWENVSSRDDADVDYDADMDVLKYRVDDVTNRCVSSPAWGILCKHVMMLPKHKCGVADMSADFRLWDRKAWSHMNYIIALDLKLDPGHVVLFLALRFLARQMLRLGTPAQEDWIRKLHRFIAPIRGDVLADMQAGKRIDLTNDGGDVLEAVGGIVHPWAS